MEKKKILIVDDERAFCELAKINLEATGEFTVQTVSDSRQAVAAVRSFVPHMILLDLIMPHIGGMEILEMLNTDEIGSRIPSVILSALEKDTDKLRAYKLGVVGYLVKPAQTVDIIQAIHKALEFK